MAQQRNEREHVGRTDGVPWKRMGVWALALGLVTNAVVAVGAAFMFRNAIGLRGVEDYRWRVEESPGWSRYEWRIDGAIFKRPEEFVPWLSRSLHEQHYQQDEGFRRSINTLELHQFVFEYWGWPCRTMWGWKYSAQNWQVTTMLFVTTLSDGGGDLLPILFPAQAGPGRRILPFYPLWPGLLANMAIFSVMWLAIFRGVRVCRRLMRMRRGVCVVCRYDLRGSESGVCPECGEGQAGAWG